MAWMGMWWFFMVGVAQAQDPPAEVEVEVTAAEAPAKEVFPVAGYEKNGFNGFFLQSKDGFFRLNIGVYTQFRYNFNWRSEVPAGTGEAVEHGFSVPRTRIFFEGRFGEHLPYHMRININGSGQVELLVALLQVNFGDMYLRVGRQFFPLSREDWMFGQDYLGIEFSENDFTFGIGTSSGLLFFHGLDHVRYWVGVSNGAFGGKEDFPSNTSSDLMVSSRVDILAAGDEWGVFDDLVGRRGRAFGMMVGLAAGYQGNFRPGTAYPNAGQIIGDVSVNGDGYQLMASAIHTWLLPDGGDADHYLGVLVQGGPWVHRLVHVYGRYNYAGAFGIAGVDPWHSAAVGVGVYPFEWTNRLKVNVEVAYAFSAINQTLVAPSGALGWLESDEPGQLSARVQTQFGF